MDLRETEPTFNSSTTETADDATGQSEQALDYQEHMGQRRKEIGHKVTSIFKERELKSDMDPRMAKTLETWAESIAENRDAYYVAGQKIWLASEDAKHQTDPMNQIIDGFFENEFKTNERLRDYAERNPKHFQKLQSATSIKATELLQDAEFTPEDQHALKFQALQEFIEEGQPIPVWKTSFNDEFHHMVTGARAVSSDFPNLYWKRPNTTFESYAETLRSEGFIENDDEWEETRRKARNKTNSEYWLIKDEDGNFQSDCYERKVSEYHYWDTFHFSELGAPTPKELLSGDDSTIEQVIRNSYRYDYDGAPTSEVREIARSVIVNRNINTSASFINRFIRDIREQISDEVAEHVNDVAKKVMGENVDKRTMTQVAREALAIGCVAEPEDSNLPHFFLPLSFEEESDCDFGYYLGVELGKGLRHILFNKNTMKEKLEPTLYETRQAEADTAIKQYFDLAEKTGNLERLMFYDSNTAQKAAQEIGLDLDFEQFLPKTARQIREGLIETEKVRREVDAYDKGIGVWSGDITVYATEIRHQYKDPSDFLANYSGLPSDIRKQHEEELRRASYAGFVKRMNQGAKGPAVDYYKCFKYGEHADEFKNYLAEVGHEDYYYDLMELVLGYKPTMPY